MRAVICPVCNGNGLVSAGFYSHPGDYSYWATASVELEKCRSCGGKGWIAVDDGEVWTDNPWESVTKSPDSVSNELDSDSN